MPSSALLRPENDVHARVREHGLAHLPDGQPERRVLERLLHLSAAERAQVAAVLGRGAVGVLAREVLELGSVDDLLSEALEDLQGLVAGAGDVLLAPGGGAAGGLKMKVYMKTTY